MTALAPRRSRSAMMAFASKDLSAIRAPNVTPSMRGDTPAVSKRCPGRSTKRTRLPSASVSATIFVVMPPLERPMGRPHDGEQSWRSDLADLIEAGLNEGAGEFATVMGIVPRGALVDGGCDGRGPAGWPRVASMGSLSGRRVRPER